MNGIMLFMVVSFSHVFDIEVPSSGITFSLLEVSYSTPHLTLRTSPVVLPFMFPVVLRVSSKNAFLKFLFVPFYGGYIMTSSYPEIQNVSSPPLYGLGGGMWIGNKPFRIIPDFGLYVQDRTTYFGRLSLNFRNIFAGVSLGNSGTTGIEALYVFHINKGFFIFGFKYPGIHDMGINLPVVPILNFGITF